MQSAVERARHARRAGLLIAAGLVVAAAWFLVPGPSSSAPVEDSRVDVLAVSPVEEPILALAAVEMSDSPPTAAESRVVLEDQPARDLDVRRTKKRTTSARRGEFGVLTVRAIDVVTRAPLDHMRVRVANASRIADRNSSRGVTSVDLRLTPGTYTPLVLVPGYEELELDAVRVGNGANLERTASMRRGSASITGTVVGFGAAIHAELAGTGRRPRDCCAWFATVPRAGDKPTSGGRADPCAVCGYAAQFTRIRVGPAGSFVFTDLVSGTYAVRLTDERGQSDEIAPIRVELVEAQHVRIEATAPALRDVLVNMIDVDRASLAESWGANVRAAAAVEGAVSSDSTQFVAALVWRFTVSDGPEDFGYGYFSMPDPPGFSSRAMPFGGRTMGTGSLVHDRERRADEELRPTAVAPKFPDIVLESNVRDDGLVRIQGVPARALSMRLVCEPFAATVVIPESIGTAAVRAQLERISEPSADDVTAPMTFRALDAARFR